MFAAIIRVMFMNSYDSLDGHEIKKNVYLALVISRDAIFIKSVSDKC